MVFRRRVAWAESQTRHQQQTPTLSPRPSTNPRPNRE